MAEKLKSAAASFERMMLPRLNSIDGELKAINTRLDGELKAINTRLDGVNSRIDGVEKSAGENHKNLITIIDSFKSEMRAELKAVNAKVDQIDEKLDVDRRMTIMEAELKELKKKA
jgi:tetrahydromethanopterin S-methyltransferase subunit G